MMCKEFWIDRRNALKSWARFSRGVEQHARAFKPLLTAVQKATAQAFSTECDKGLFQPVINWAERMR